MVVLYKKFQNPFFPYYNNIFHSAYAPHVSFNLPPTGTEISLKHYLLLPFYFATHNSISEVLLTTVRISYVIPYFPSTVRFIGKPFVEIGNDKYSYFLTTIMNDLQENKEKNFLYTLSFKDIYKTDVRYYKTQKSLSVLTNFGLVQDRSGCRTFTTNIDDILELCPILKSTV